VGSRGDRKQVPDCKPENTPGDETLWRNKGQSVAPEKKALQKEAKGGNVSKGHVCKEL
jgi:hypothetical protein